MTTTIEAADVLERAAELIERKGWWRDDGSLNNVTGSCASLAITRVGKAGMCEADYELARMLGWRGYEHDSRLPTALVYQWNDSRSCAAEVTSTMRACAALIRARAVHEHESQPVVLEQA